MTAPCSICTWDYPTEGEIAEPSAEAVLREINGWGEDGAALSAYTELQPDGSTACGCWIYCGCFAGETNQPARRKPGSEQTWVAPEWGWAWPANRRILYNRASADPDGRPWSERKRYVWWDEEQGKWTGEDVPDFQPDKRPDYVPADGRQGGAGHRGDHAVHHAGRRPRLAVRARRAGRRADAHPLRAARVAVREPALRPAVEPGAPGVRAAGQPLQPLERRAGAGRYPFVVTSYRLTEHHTAGGMSRFVSYLSELQPEMFCEVSPELAAERGLEHGGWATISTERAAIEARVMVTDRMRPLRVQGRVLHQVGLPYHWGTGGSAVRRRGQRPVPDRARPQRAHPGGQGRHLRHPARPPAGGRDA